MNASKFLQKCLLEFGASSKYGKSFLTFTESRRDEDRYREQIGFCSNVNFKWTSDMLVIWTNATDRVETFDSLQRIIRIS